MTNRPSAFKKTPLAIGIATLIAGSSIAHGASWDFGDVSINLDSNFTLATSIRTEKRDLGLIGNSNLPVFDWTGYNAATNVIYPSQDVWALANGVGSYSTNGDLGNLSFDQGDSFSTQISGLHELDITYGDYGFFARGLYFYDFEMLNGSRPWSNPITGKEVDLCDDPEARNELCSDIRLLDAFAYADIWVGDMPLTVRIGDQVVSWGESTFIQHGINSTNPVDVTRARAPGAELKEVFIPVGMVFASLGVSENLNLSAYYQYEWEKSLLPVAGSYFATNDFAGEGGQTNNIQLGFTGNPDIDLDYLLGAMNDLGDALRGGANQAAIGNALLAHSTKVGVRGFSDAAHDDADDQGQYGIKIGYFAEELNSTEFGFYHLNYHSQRPLINGIASDFTQAGIGADLAFLASNEITRHNITDLNTFAEARFVYPEDIKLYGISFNTNVGTTALAGEVAYRQDEPLQMDDVELLYAAMPEQLAIAGLRPDLAGISQYANTGRVATPGGVIDGVLYSDTVQAQMTASHVFGPMFGSDNFVLLGEVAYVNINDFPDPNVIRLETPGTARTPSLEPIVNPDGSVNNREGLHIGLSNGPETNEFATSSAWGYRLLAVADHNNIFSGINLRTRVTFSHDVNGTTPNPLFLFTEDVKSANISFTFDYLSRWSVSASYNAFWDGAGTANPLSDRDFVSFNIKYAI
ncbi:DUF1302 domain-containing protein [Alteromonas oceanisediminis]|uniref:DUF1302 domain-containing protein n=1 Tax=Alteromonas oceanisediminis TaxID=2836180 RepID=UPI001BDB3856|nr:DUF1302 domain-containing protein [Alteromonas oceanisediminis]MBT0587119.1 DUF1302 family protein [Alteromonas oceanisediminis]